VTQRILITSGAGFIGFHLARYLKSAGHEVCLADNHIRGVRDPDFLELISDSRVASVEIDLLGSSETMSLGEDFDVIFHLAAIIGVRHVQERPYDVLVHNTRMLENVISLARKQQPSCRLLFASTSEIYAGTLKHFGLSIPTSEDAVLTVTALELPRTSYMLSKIMGEAMVQHSGVPFTIFRPHNIYGPRMGLAHVIPEQLKNAFDAAPGDAISVFSPEHKRAFCFVDDAVEMLARMAFNEACQGTTLNLGAQTPEVSILQLVQTCVEISGKTLTLNKLPPTPGSPERRAPDMRTTAKLLDYEATVGLRDGISRTWNWYRDNVFETDGLTAQ
jgi:nucleoside-diphosphate-sugar epimerase